MADDAVINFGPGPAGKEFAPVPVSDIYFLHIDEATQLQFSAAPPENAMSFSGGLMGVQALNRSDTYRPAGA